MVNQTLSNLLKFRMRRRPEEIYQKVVSLLQREKPFLDPHLSLRRLAVIVGTNTQYLSAAIRECTGGNFRSLINDFRIQYAQELFRDRVTGEINYGSFYTECGFLSKSAFYVAFKKRLNKTPKQYVHENLFEAVSRGTAMPDC